MNRLLNGIFVPSRLVCDIRFGPPDPPDPKPKPPSKGTVGAASASLITSTGGLFGSAYALLVPFFDNRSTKFVFAIYDPFNFDCEEDCVYDFRQEDKPGRVIDVHKVYLQYRDIGKVTYIVKVTATQYNRVTGKETIDTKSKTITVGNVKPDLKIHSYFVDLKVQGERPQLNITRKADKGPLSIVTAMLIGNSNEENQL